LITLEPGQVTLSTILRHEAKQNTYKIALVRALNDIRLSHIDFDAPEGVAVPLRRLAEFWLAYYWPFVDGQNPLPQGPRATRDDRPTNDLSFRPILTLLRDQWRTFVGMDTAADGFTVIHEMRVLHRRKTYPAQLWQQYQQTVKAIIHALRQPIRYAGEGQYSVFSPPVRASGTPLPKLPGTGAEEVCVIVLPALWDSLARLSLWVEALCVHQWAEFSAARLKLDAGMIYNLLVARPNNRRPLKWERNRVELLMMDGHQFICPWTEKLLTPESYDLDHLVPLTIYPINELWNLVPSDEYFNRHRKGQKMPSYKALDRATPHLISTYQSYLRSVDLSAALKTDLVSRFHINLNPNPKHITDIVKTYVTEIGRMRNIAQF
jgi:HNH endonuclease